jgi:AmiR/NasT family two-component response regulator
MQRDETTIYGELDIAFGRLRVLIAEDETIIRLDLRQLLEANGLEVCGEARDGEEAVALARELQPDVALLDVKMPRLDGIEAGRRISAERPLPIVMLTAYGDRRLVRRALDAGVFGYLVKPFREHDLVPALRAACARHAELLEARRALGSLRGPSERRVRFGRVYAGDVRVDVRREGRS